jgi:GTP-binding protein
VNKWDLAAGSAAKCEAELKRVMPFIAHCPVVIASAETGFNVRKSIEQIDYVAAQVQTELPTGILNGALTDAFSKMAPPVLAGRRLKVFYATQVGRAPIRIRIFVNDPARVQTSYASFLVRMLRQRFGLEGAPVVLQFRARR